MNDDHEKTFEKIKSPAAAGLICDHTIHVPEFATHSSIIMRQHRERQGIPENICGRRAQFVFGEKPYCSLHAGQMALRLLTKQSDRGKHHD